MSYDVIALSEFLNFGFLDVFIVRGFLVFFVFVFPLAFVLIYNKELVL